MVFTRIIVTEETARSNKNNNKKPSYDEQLEVII